MPTTPAIPPTPVISPSELGTLLRRHRKAQGMTQEYLAAASGTGKRFIVDLEAGKRTCQLGPALRVAQMLGLSLTVGRRADSRA
jgi:y4mF family transcriptional regulator